MIHNRFNGRASEPVMEALIPAEMAERADCADLTWVRFLLHNLLPVTIGNIIGGSVMVGLVYGFLYLRNKETD
jgi:formate transporter